jgi:hypothetical protein
MCNLLVHLPVQRLRSMLHLTPVNVSWAEQSAQTPPHPRHSDPMIRQLLPSLLAATLPLEPVVLVKRVFLCEHSPCANPGVMISLSHLHPPNLVNSHSAFHLVHPINAIGSFPQRYLPGHPTFMKVLWIRTLNHLRHPSPYKPTATASQIGRGIMRGDLLYPVHRVRSGARPVLAHSSDVSHGARWCRA